MDLKSCEFQSHPILPSLSSIQGFIKVISYTLTYFTSNGSHARYKKLSAGMLTCTCSTGECKPVLNEANRSCGTVYIYVMKYEM